MSELLDRLAAIIRDHHSAAQYHGTVAQLDRAIARAVAKAVLEEARKAVDVATDNKLASNAIRSLGESL